MTANPNELRRKPIQLPLANGGPSIKKELQAYEGERRETGARFGVFETFVFFVTQPYAGW